MRVAVTGATGFVGRRLVRALTMAGHDVLPLVREGRPGVPLTKDVTALTASLQDVDAVVHLAAFYVRTERPEDVAPLVDTQVGLGAALLEACRQAQVPRLVTADSYLARGGPDGTVPVDLYGATRRAFDALLAYHEDAWGLAAVRLVLHDVYGPDDPKPRLVPVLLRALRSGTPAPLADGLVDLVHVEDVVAAFVHALHRVDALAGQAFAVRSGETLSPAQVADRLARACGRPVPVLPGAYPAPPRPAWLPWPGPDLPGWAPVTGLDAGLAALGGAG